MNYYNEIKNKVIDNEVYSKVKDYSKGSTRLLQNMKSKNFLENFKK